MQAAKAIAGEMEDDKQHDQDDEDDPKHLHPAWCAGGRSPVGLSMRL